MGDIISMKQYIQERAAKHMVVGDVPITFKLSDEHKSKVQQAMMDFVNKASKESLKEK